MSKITKVLARQVFDSRGNPTVEAPDGQIDDELIFFEKTSASTVGLPLLSKTCLAITLVILLIKSF